MRRWATVMAAQGSHVGAVTAVARLVIGLGSGPRGEQRMCCRPGHVMEVMERDKAGAIGEAGSPVIEKQT